MGWKANRFVEADLKAVEWQRVATSNQAARTCEAAMVRTQGLAHGGRSSARRL